MKADGGWGVSVMGRFELCFLGDRNLCRMGSFLVTCLCQEHLDRLEMLEYQTPLVCVWCRIWFGWCILPTAELRWVQLSMDSFSGWSFREWKFYERTDCE